MAEAEEPEYKPPPVYEMLEEDKKILERTFEPSMAPRIAFSENRFIYPRTFCTWHPKYKSYAIKSSDVWVVSLPKAGTTWTQEMAWCILYDLDYAEAEKRLLMDRFPFFEWDGILSEDNSALPEMDENDPCRPGNTWKLLQNLKEPRTIKSHFHKELLPDDIWKQKGKIIYVCRDPKDICVSYYYHEKKLDGYIGNWDDFFDLFLKDLHYYSPIWEHILGYWNARHLDHVLFIRYEELKEDLPNMCKKVAKFLGKELSESQVASLTNHLSFDNMSKNKSTNNEAIVSVSKENKDIKFMRKGKVGDWRAHFTDNQIQQFKEWTLQKLKDTDFPYYRKFE